MKKVAAALALFFVPVAQAQATPRQFNLECRDVQSGGRIEERISLVMSVDLDRKLSCRQWQSSCFVKPLVEQGRWIDLSYTFTTQSGEEYEMYRLYDRTTGWLDQVVRRTGEAGNPYGDSVCKVVAYTPFQDSRTAPPADVR